MFSSPPRKLRRAYAVASLLTALFSAAVSAALLTLSEDLPKILEKVSVSVTSGDKRIEARKENASPTDASPKIAIVIDDCGADMSMARRVLSSDVPMTWAILPYLRYSSETAEMLREAGAPYMIHVPMQAEVDLPGKAGQRGPYLIGTGMSRDEVRETLVPVLDSLEGAFGINNHRGSKATSDRDLMDAVMEVISERNLFFFDSRTSPRSVAYDSAVKHGLRAVSNSLFLDGEADRDKIASRMGEALRLAHRKGTIAVICHLRPETVAFLEDFAGEFVNENHESGVKFITLAEWPDYDF